LATEAHIHVPIIDNDVYDESGRAFRVILCDPSEGTKLAHNVATISIIEDDGEYFFIMLLCIPSIEQFFSFLFQF